MSQETIDIIQAVSAILSVIVAATALVVAFLVERRNHLRFQTQLDESKNLAEGNVKPLLVIYTTGYKEYRSITLANQGQGSAIITDYSIDKQGVKGENFRSVLTLSKNAKIYHWRFGGTTLILPAGDKRVLTSLSKDDLIAQMFSETESESLLSEFWNELHSIEMSINYTDIYGNHQPKCIWKSN